MALTYLEAHPDSTDMAPTGRRRQVSSNSRDRLLSGSFHGSVDIPVGSGGTIAPTVDERLKNGHLRFTGSPSTDPVLEIPEAIRQLGLENVSTRDITITSPSGDLLLEGGTDKLLLEDGSGVLQLESPTVLLPAGETGIFFKDGDDYHQAGSVGEQSGTFLFDGSVPASGDHNWVDRVISRPTFRDIAEVVGTPSSSSGTLTLNMELGNAFETTLTEDVTTLVLDNPPASGKMGKIFLITHQDSTGSWVITWPAPVIWEQDTGLSPGQTMGAGNVTDIFAFITLDAGATWYGFVMGLDFG